MKILGIKKHSLLLLILFWCFSLPFSGLAQTARDNFGNAEKALEEDNLQGCLTYLDRCESQLGGSNVRIEALRAQCYAQMDEWVKAKVAFRNFYNMLDAADRGGDTWEKMVELGKEIDAGLNAQEIAFKQKKEDEKKENLQRVEAEIKQKEVRKSEKEKKKNKENDERLYQYALESRDENALALYKEVAGSIGSTTRTKKVQEELDKQKNPDNFIIKEVENGDLKEVAFLIKKGADKNLKNRMGESLIHIAVKNGNLNILDFLIKAGANIEATNYEGETPVLFAIKNGNSGALDLLLKNKANIESENRLGKSGVYYCLDFNKPDLLPILVKYGANLEKPYLDAGVTVTPLFFAVFNLKSKALANTLINNGSLIDNYGNTNWTPLMAAVYLGDKEMVNLLISNKADINKKGPFNWTALHFATRKKDPEISKILLQNGADKKAKDDWKRTPLKIAKERRYKEVKKVF